ncbi:CMRF35-like molecule 5 isoform X1 [Equus przewalskii]|uniref:CMRF35-like molecule 5 isoform X1 n=1 Tax=Equus przewalskii TaxID=9798 RepID=A0ABM2EL46_EQUPR
MRLLPALLLLIIPGCFSIHGPGTVSGPEGGSVTIECHYNSGWETYKKWWGRGNAWRSCRILVKTTGSKQEVKKDRVSIKDDHRCRTFAVTMEKLRSDDEDTYWCGIERYGIDRGVQVKVTIDPAAYTTTPPTLLITNTTESMTTDQSEPMTPASLTSSSPVTQSVNNSQPLPLTSPLIRVLLCNIHFVLLTSMKVPLLGILLCTVMWLSRSQRDSRGKQRQSEQENRSSHAIDTLTPEEQTSGTS